MQRIERGFQCTAQRHDDCRPADEEHGDRGESYEVVVRIHDRTIRAPDRKFDDVLCFKDIPARSHTRVFGLTGRPDDFAGAPLDLPAGMPGVSIADRFAVSAGEFESFGYAGFAVEDAVDADKLGVSDLVALARRGAQAVSNYEPGSTSRTASSLAVRA